jgi:predicted ATP-dependent serine protease
MRVITLKKMSLKTFKIFQFQGIWQQLFGQPESSGIWLIYGNEKNGKTSFCLMLAEMLSSFKKVLYVSAEQGIDMAFVDATKRLNISVNNNKLIYCDYAPIQEIETLCKSRKGPSIFIIDNATVYADELKNGKLRKLSKTYTSKLFVLIAHEEKNEPYTAVAKVAKKLANIIVNVKGLKAIISGRCPGGVATINEEKAQLFWGHENKEIVNG